MCPYGCMGLIARLYRSTGEVERAEEICAEMVRNDPREPDAYIGLAEIRNFQERFSEEAGYLEQAISVERFSELSAEQRAGVHYSLAFARYNEGDLEKAADAIHEATSLRSDLADWHVLAGWIDLKRDRSAEALVRFERAQSLDSKLTAAYTGQGDALVAISDYKAARPAFEQAHNLDPDDNVITLKLAHCAAVLGDLETARSLVDEAAHLDKEHLPQDLLSRVTELLGDDEKSDDKSQEKKER